MRIDKKNNLAKKRHYRVRKKVRGSAERPRLSLKLTNKHLYAQCIDDDLGVTLVFLSSLSSRKNNKDAVLVMPNVDGAKSLGKQFGELAKAKGVKEIVFDRGSRRYHGVVKAFAEAARESLLF